MSKQDRLALLATVSLATGLATLPAAADVIDVGNIRINIVDPMPANGFDDPTPAAPVGGNPGTTIGEQRREAYKKAAEIWDGILDPQVRITVQASFTSLNCTATGGTLGAAGTITVWQDFGGESFPSTWYNAALANELASVDLGGTDPDPGLLLPPFNDEIVSFFNADLGKPGCLEASAWYYGFDHDAPPGTIDFLNVLTHELGHGLGFQSFADESTGQNFLGFPDMWSRFQRDNVLAGKNWHQMVDIERGFSAVNGPNLVWTGPNVTAAAPGLLGPALVILVNAPASVAGTELPYGTASFGPPAAGETGDVVLANDGVGTASDGCQPIVNDVAGKIALIDRGACTFVLKAQNAEAAGAAAVIIANNVAGGTPPGLGGSGIVGIPTVSVTQSGGQLLRSNPGTNVSIGVPNSAGDLAGTDPNGFVRLYAPSPAAPGSSVSHYDVSAVPNLLMEPFISPDLEANGPRGVDLTDELLADIGWNGAVNCPADSNDGPTVVLNGCDTGVENRQGAYTVFPSKKWILPGGIFPAPALGAVTGGCYVADLLDYCAPVLATQPGQYTSCIAQVTNDMKAQGILSDSEQGAIRACAAGR